MTENRGRPKKVVNWSAVDLLFQYGCSQEFIASEIAKDNGIPRPDKKTRENYAKTLTRQLLKKHGMNFVQYRAMMVDKTRALVWQKYLKIGIIGEDPKVLKDIIDRIDGKPQDNVKLSGDQQQPVHIEVKQTNYDNLTAAELLQLEILAKQMQGSED